MGKITSVLLWALIKSNRITQHICPYILYGRLEQCLRARDCSAYNAWIAVEILQFCIEPLSLLNVIVCTLIKISPELGVQLKISHHWYRQWLGFAQATSHYLNQLWSSQVTKSDDAVWPKWFEMEEKKNVPADVVINRIWILCLVSISTTRFASELR